MQHPIRKIGICLIIIVLAGAIFIAYKIETTIKQLGHAIEQRALPVLRIDIPIIKKNFLKVIPSTQSMLNVIHLGPLSPGKIFEKTIDMVQKPIMKSVLEHTRRKLNQELSLIKITKLDYKQEHKHRTFTAYCSYDIKIIITGHHFKQIISTERNNWRTVTFVCD